MRRSIALGFAALCLACPLSAQVLPLRTEVPPLTPAGCVPEGVRRAPAPEAVQRQEAEQLAARATEATLLGDDAVALALLQRAAELDPTSPRIAFLLARALDGAGRAGLAMEAYCRYLGLSPDAPDAEEIRHRLGDLKDTLGFTVPAAAAAAFDSGVVAFRAGNWRQAEAAFTRAAEVIPGWMDPVYNRGVTLLSAGQPEAAGRDLRRYLEANPGAPEFSAVLDVLAATQQPAPAAAGPYSPQAALLSGLIVPGLGHMTTGRTGTGILVFVVTAGLAGAGLLVEESRVDCLSPPVGGRCPAEQVLRETTERPLLVPALAAAAGAAILSAVDARRGAVRRNAEAAGRGGDAMRSLAPEVRADRDGMHLTLLRVRF